AGDAVDHAAVACDHLPINLPAGSHLLRALPVERALVPPVVVVPLELAVGLNRVDHAVAAAEHRAKALPTVADDLCFVPLKGQMRPAGVTVPAQRAVLRDRVEVLGHAAFDRPIFAAP